MFPLPPAPRFCWETAGSSADRGAHLQPPPLEALDPALSSSSAPAVGPAPPGRVPGRPRSSAPPEVRGTQRQGPGRGRARSAPGAQTRPRAQQGGAPGDSARPTELSRSSRVAEGAAPEGRRGGGARADWGTGSQSASAASARAGLRSPLIGRRAALHLHICGAKAPSGPFGLVGKGRAEVGRGRAVRSPPPFGVSAIAWSERGRVDGRPGRPARTNEPSLVPRRRRLPGATRRRSPS